MPIVQISLVDGRDDRLKERLVRSVTDAVVEAIGVAPEQVRVLVYELPPGNWAVGGRTKEETS